jgi:hypothetical protein
MNNNENNNNNEMNNNNTNFVGMLEKNENIDNNLTHKNTKAKPIELTSREKARRGFQRIVKKQIALNRMLKLINGKKTTEMKKSILESQLSSAEKEEIMHNYEEASKKSNDFFEENDVDKSPMFARLFEIFYDDFIKAMEDYYLLLIELMKLVSTMTTSAGNSAANFAMEQINANETASTYWQSIKNTTGKIYNFTKESIGTIIEVLGPFLNEVYKWLVYFKDKSFNILTYIWENPTTIMWLFQILLSIKKIICKVYSEDYYRGQALEEVEVSMYQSTTDILGFDPAKLAYRSILMTTGSYFKGPVFRQTIKQFSYFIRLFITTTVFAIPGLGPVLAGFLNIRSNLDSIIELVLDQLANSIQTAITALILYEGYKDCVELFMGECLVKPTIRVSKLTRGLATLGNEVNKVTSTITDATSAITNAGSTTINSVTKWFTRKTEGGCYDKKKKKIGTKKRQR